MIASSRAVRWVSVLVLLLIIARLAIEWPQRGLWYDETVNAYFAEQSWSAIWKWCTCIDNQMPLDFVLRRLWGHAAGTSEFALRTFSVWCAVLASAAVMALGRRIGGNTAGWLAALVFALSQGFLYAAYEVRPYALALALFAWSSVFLWELWEGYAAGTRPLDRQYVLWLAAYWLLAVGLLYTHYSGFLALAAHGAYLGWQTWQQPARRRVTILAHLAAGLMIGYLPWVLALAGRDVRAGTAYAGHIGPGQAFETYLRFFVYGQHLVPDDTLPYAWVIALVVVAGASVRLAFDRRATAHHQRFLLAIWITVVPLLGLLVFVNAVQAKLSGRHGWPVWIGAALLTGVGLSALDRFRLSRWPVWGAVLLVVWLPARASLQPVYNSYLREAFDYINRQAEPGDVLVLRDGTLFTAASYYDAALPWTGLPGKKLMDVNQFLFFDEAITDLMTLVERNHARRVWVVAWQGHIMDPQNLVMGILESIGDSQPLPGAYGFGDVSVSLYVLHDSPGKVAEAVGELHPLVQIPPDGPIFLGGEVLNADPVPHGGIVLVHTWWQRGAVVMPGMRISARLYDPSGTFYAQHDQPPVAASFGQELWKPGSPILSRFILWVPETMPPGPAEVKLVLYDMDGTFEPITVPVGEFVVAD